MVATPIGNLEDITLRALRVLREVAAIACEDTRTTKKLLARHEIEAPLISYHAYSAPEVTEQIIQRLEAGEDIALVTDAGTPGVSDPGEALVAAAIARNITVVPIPGPSALLAALVGSGIPTRFVLFLGFLPREESEQREIFAPLRAAPYTLVLYESPNRVHKTLGVLQRILGDREAAVGRELTKKFETFERGRLSELEGRFSGEVLGEITIVVAPATGEAGVDFARARSDAKQLLDAGGRTSDIAQAIASVHGLARQEAYQLVLELKKEPR